MKKAFAVILAICMVLGLAIPCAAETIDVFPDEPAAASVEDLLSTYDYRSAAEKARNGYIDERVSSEIIDGIKVSGADSYSVEYIGKIEANSRSGEPERTVYSITATNKTVSGTNTEDNVEANITMVWIDNAGTTNTLYHIYGEWNPNGRTLSNRLVTYGWNNITDSYYTGMRPPGNSYDFYPQNIEGFQVSAVASVDSSGYESNPIMVEVSSSMFQ